MARERSSVDPRTEEGRRTVDEHFAALAADGSRRHRDALVEIHLPLAIHLARRFESRGIPLDDLIQVASVGLVNAVDRFDPSRGLAFSTFATPTIVGELKRHFRDKGWAVRVPRRIQELHREVNQAAASLSMELGRSATIKEIAARVDASEEEVLEALDVGQAYRSKSLDTPVGGDDGEGLSLSDRLGDDDVELELAENRVLITELLETLPKREQLMLQLRFFKGMTQSEIADRLGISQMHVSRLLRKSLAMLKERVESADSQS